MLAIAVKATSIRSERSGDVTKVTVALPVQSGQCQNIRPGQPDLRDKSVRAGPAWDSNGCEPSEPVARAQPQRKTTRTV